VSRHRRSLAPVGFLLPFGLPFIMFFLVPIGYGIYQSLFKVQRLGALGLEGSKTVFAGIDNYTHALNDPRFVSSILRVLLFAVVEVPAMILLALALALLLDTASARLPRMFRSAFFMPYGVPGVIASIMWGFLYTPGISPILRIFSDIGLPTNFLGEGSVLWAIANIVTWQFAGYNMLVITAQLKSVSADLYESAHIDGANGWQTAWHIKIPLVRPAVVLTTVFTIIGTIQLFSEPFVLKAVSPAINSTYTPNLAAYNDAFSYNNYNLGAAESVFLAVVAFVLSFSFLKLVARRSGR
jgi:multiple sugar transport system permease protein